MTLSPRYLVAVNLVLLALAAYSASAIVGTAVEGWLVPSADVELSPPPPPIPPEAKKPQSHYAVIKRRDIFNSARPPAPAPDVAPPAQKVTPLKLKLWGVALFEGGGSYCVIENQGPGKKRKKGGPTQDLYRVGQLVGGGATVKAIEWDRVILSRNGQDEILQMESTTAKPGAPVRPGRAAIKKVAQDDRIREISENEYEVDRSQVDDAMENMSQLFTQIRAVPHFEGGKATGFRLFAIRSGSLFDKIGVKNGDIIQSINGTPMTDPAGAMAMLQQLRDETDLTVDLVRNRQPQTLTYSIQ
jgi:general secretion pathway protein C